MKLKELGLGSSYEYYQQHARLEKYGYRIGANQEDYNREAVLLKLQELAKARPEVEEELLLWWEHYADGIDEYDELYLVTPVMLAMLLKEYELAEKLIDMGYWANDLLLKNQIYCEVGAQHLCVYLYISQLLTAWDDIPDGLFRKICEEISYTGLDYKTDYWANPFLMTSTEIIVHQKSPSMKGLQRILEYDSEMLSGIINSIRGNIDEYIPTNSREWKKLFGNLLVLISGHEDDLKALIDQFAPGRSQFFYHYGSDPKFRRFWIKMLPEFKKIYSCHEESHKVFFEHLLMLYYSLCTEVKNEKDKKTEKQALEVLELIKTSCPEWYTFDHYLNFMTENIYWENYPEMTGLWKQCVKKDITFEKTSDSFYLMLDCLFGKKAEEDMDDDDYDMDTSLRAWNKDQRILKGIRLLEELKDSDFKYEVSDENDREMLSYLISTLLDFGSEELLLTCLNVHLLPKEILPSFIKSAVHFGRKELLPVLILYNHRM